MIVLHPMHWLFKQFKHPMCPECQREIMPLTAVDIEEQDDGRTMFRHAECVELQPEEPKAV